MKSNIQVLEELNKTVYGHTYVKKVLINAVNRSKKRYLQRWRDNLSEAELIPNLSCLLIGESGTGKSFLIQELSRIMGFPYIMFDMSHLNIIAGRTGLSVKNIEARIKQKAEDYFKSNEANYQSVDGVLSQMVVFFDEFDKLGLDGGSGDWQRKAQSEILLLLENQGQFKDLTFIMAGAFSNLELRMKQDKKCLGFFKNSCNQTEFINLDQQLITKGNILTEVLGRTGIVVQLDEFTEGEYRLVLIDYILPQLNRQLELAGFSCIDLSSTEVDDLIRRAHKSELGIRGIKRELMRKSMGAEFAQELFTADDKEQLSYIAGV